MRIPAATLHECGSAGHDTYMEVRKIPSQVFDLLDTDIQSAWVDVAKEIIITLNKHYKLVPRGSPKV